MEDVSPYEALYYTNQHNDYYYLIGKNRRLTQNKLKSEPEVDRGSLHINDVVKTSAIEGENLNPEEVCSSIARRLGIDIAGLIPASRDVEGIVEIMLDATQQFAKPLTRDRLFDWHAALFPTGRSGMHRITVGGWRTPDAEPMRVVSGPIGKEKVHFEAPDAGRLEKEMQAFLEWFDNGHKIDPVLTDRIKRRLWLLIAARGMRSRHF